MPRLSRRSLFAGVAALPALVPAMAAVRPYATGGIASAKISLVGETLSALTVECRRPYRPTKSDIMGLFEAVDTAVARPQYVADIAADDRAFGWEG
jgi:hypothetical protein